MDNNPTVVNPPVTTETAKVEVPETTTTPAPGAKTPSELLLKSLQEEREKRRLIEEELQALKTVSTTSEDVYSDEGKLLKKQLDSALEQINSITEEREIEKIYAQYPLLREKDSEFTEYRKAEHPRAKLESVAKLYLAENGLLDPVRKGLEKPTGGPRIPLSTAMSVDEIKELREKNFRKYQEMLEKGQISI